MVAAMLPVPWFVCGSQATIQPTQGEPRQKVTTKQKRAQQLGHCQENEAFQIDTQSTNEPTWHHQMRILTLLTD
ncbi:hypothetical protein B0T24DRAFT_600721 [Lasiosphaeria ovina]|uniref:Uncharacterized protein n=1 Tax=Lasiosphaeria ovina TaxID=92902 RepID=A0AAE0TWQ8_9PEZI|nr:hypothetical protein B0T24DRAFT_600721 [Lasiosphaeria ovina]